MLEKIFPNFALKREMAKLEMAKIKMYQKVVESSTPTFAQDTDETSWTSANKELEHYDENDFQQMRYNARKLQYTAAGKCILQTLQDFIIGKNANITAVDENPDVQKYIDNFISINKWDTLSKEIIKRAFRDGEVFIRYFYGPDHIFLRLINPEEITDHHGRYSFGIETDPNDLMQIKRYYRTWGSFNHETIEADDMLHIKLNVDCDIKRGVSFFVGIAEYMKHYENWIRDRITLNRLRSFYNVVFKPDATAPATFKSNFTDVTNTYKTSNDGSVMKKAPKRGSAIVAKGFEVEYPTLNINASDTKDDGRSIELMIAKGTSFPEYIIRGDASNANYASTMVQESPFIRAMESWQDFFEAPFKEIFKKAIHWGKVRNILQQSSVKTTIIYNPETKQDDTKTEPIETSEDVTIDWAALTHRDIQAETSAYQIQNMMGVVSKKTISAKLGYNYNDEKQQLMREYNEDMEGQNPHEDLQDTQTPPAASDDEQNNDGDNDKKEGWVTIDGNHVMIGDKDGGGGGGKGGKGGKGSNNASDETKGSANFFPDSEWKGKGKALSTYSKLISDYPQLKSVKCKWIDFSDPYVRQYSAQTGQLMAGYAERDTNTIRLNISEMQRGKASKAVLKANEGYMQAVEPEDIITHEMGHMLLFKNEASGKSHLYSNWSLGLSVAARDNVSEYASTNHDEAFAESFTQYRKGNASETALKILKLGGLKL